MGSVSYILFLLVLFTEGINFIQGFVLYPILLVVPGMNNSNLGMAGLPLSLLGLLIGIFLFPIIFICIAKLLRIETSTGKVVMGFLISAVVANIVKLLFGL